MNPTTTSHAALVAEVTALRASLGDAVEMVESLRADRDALRAALAECVRLLDANAIALVPDSTENQHPIVRRARAALVRSAL